MRRLIPFLLLATASAAPLAAQSWDGPGRGPDRSGDQRRPDPRTIENGRIDRPGSGWRDGDRPGPDRGGPDRGGPGRDGPDRRDWRDDDRGRPDRGGWRGDNRPGERRDGVRGDWRNDGPGGRPGWRDDRNHAWNGGRNGWNDGWRNDRRYDWQGYRASNRALYRAPRYYGPRGYDYSRWSRGYRVEPYFYGRTYWINDPYRYRLPPAYGSYRWVRYYDDVALIDIRSGLIEDIIYSFFYR